MFAFFPLEDRIQIARHPMTKQLLSLMLAKKTNLVLSCDVTRCETVLDFAKQLGDHIAILKTHVDMLDDFHPDFTSELQAIAASKQFLIFEDRKFADIGSTVQAQYHQGIFQISRWADMVNAHALPGDGVIEGLKQQSKTPPSILLIAEMSSRGHLMHADYQAATLQMAMRHADVVTGFITQHRLSDQPEFLHMAPGISLESTQDGLGQQYKTPEKAILENGIDLIIVGRGIIQHPNPQQITKEYQDRAWNAFRLAIG